MWLRALLACGLAVPLPLSAVTSQSFQVSATIIPGCLIVGGSSNYGALTYGGHSALATSTVTAALTGGVTLQCTPGVTLSMSVDGGQHSREPDRDRAEQVGRSEQLGCGGAWVGESQRSSRGEVRDPL